MEILFQLLQHGFEPTTQVQYAIGDGMFLVKISEYARAFGINPGYGQLGEIVPGVSFANSEVGLLAFSIEAFFYRGVCTNGLISKTSSTLHASSTSAIVAWKISLRLWPALSRILSASRSSSSCPANQWWMSPSAPSKHSAGGSVCHKQKRRWCDSPIECRNKKGEQHYGAYEICI